MSHRRTGACLLRIKQLWVTKGSRHGRARAAAGFVAGCFMAGMRLNADGRIRRYLGNVGNHTSKRKLGAATSQYAEKLKSPASCLPCVREDGMGAGRPIVNLRLATSETWRDKATGERRERTEWHRVVIFNENLAKVAEQYLKKGAKIY